MSLFSFVERRTPDDGDVISFGFKGDEAEETKTSVISTVEEEDFGATGLENLKKGQRNFKILHERLHCFVVWKRGCFILAWAVCVCVVGVKKLFMGSWMSYSCSVQ